MRLAAPRGPSALLIEGGLAAHPSTARTTGALLFEGQTGTPGWPKHEAWPRIPLTAATASSD